MRWLVLILGIFLSGCFVHYDGAAYQGPPPLLTTTLAQVNGMVGAQQPAAYKVGFMQGCDSGRVSAGENSYIFKKDVERFSTDDVYRQGWDDGYNRCFSGGGPAAGSYTSSTYFGFGYFPFYYPGVYYSGHYYPGYDYYSYYDPGYSIWLGYYGHDNHNYNRHYYASPWYGGHKYKGGGQHFSRWNSHKGPGGFFGGKHRGGGGKHFKGRSHGGGGGKHSKGRSHRGGGGGHKGH